MRDGICSVDGCGTSPVEARGWCKAHYRRWYRDRQVSEGTRPPKRGREVWDALTEEENQTGLRRCLGCDAHEPLVEFAPLARARNGRDPKCRSCRTEQVRRTNRRQYERNPEERARRSRELRMQRKYGMTMDQYNALREAQGNACAVCSRAVALVVDHCHERGTVRALLCTDCNLALGHVHDDPAVLQSMILYLESHRAKVA